jgi:hypothetical protein
MMKFNTEPKNTLESLGRRLRSLQGLRYAKDFQGVETVLYFIGYPRSGHTLLGSMLDAHPEMVIAHELDALYYYQAGYSNSQLYYLILENSRKFTRDGREWQGYSYAIPDQWQGRFRTLRVIGDKCGGRTSHRMKLAGSTDLIYRAHVQSGQKVKLLHVIRNPFDNLTTMAKRTVERKGAILGTPLLKRQMRLYFNRCQYIDEIRQKGEIPVLDIHLDDLMTNTVAELRRTIEFIGLEPDPAYLEACASLVWKKPSRTRFKIPELWTPENIQLAREQMAPYDFFSRYAFDNTDS